MNQEKMSRLYFEHCLGFTCEAAGGNAAGVVLPEQDRLLTDAERQAAAKALGFSDTVFVSSVDIVQGQVQGQGKKSDSVAISLRYLTPLAEVDLCAHATIACLGLLHSSKRLAGIGHGKLHTRAGEVGFRIEEMPGNSGVKCAADAVAFVQQLAPTISAPLQVRMPWASAPIHSCANTQLPICTAFPLFYADARVWFESARRHICRKPSSSSSLLRSASAWSSSRSGLQAGLRAPLAPASVTCWSKCQVWTICARCAPTCLPSRVSARGSKWSACTPFARRTARRRMESTVR